MTRCTGCGQPHRFQQCTRFSTVQQKIDRLKALSACWKCFSRNHTTFACRNQNCAHCGGKHNIAICKRRLQSYNGRSNFPGTMRRSLSFDRFSRRRSPGGRYSRYRSPSLLNNNRSRNASQERRTTNYGTFRNNRNRFPSISPSRRPERQNTRRSSSRSH